MSSSTILTLPVCVTALLLAACTTAPPDSPSVMVLPGAGKSFEQFRADNDACKQYAREETGGRSADSVALDSGVRSAAVGTVLGAAAGAAINGRRGAGVGAGSGLALGGLAGTETGQASASSLQQRYDFSYEQCMYAKGHRVPVAGGLMNEFFHGRYVTPPPPSAPSR